MSSPQWRLPYVTTNGRTSHRRSDDSLRSQDSFFAPDQRGRKIDPGFMRRITRLKGSQPDVCHRRIESRLTPGSDSPTGNCPVSLQGVKARAASVISKLEYVSTVAAVGGYLFQNAMPSVPSNFGYGGLIASYNLFDFGKRERAVKEARVRVSIGQALVIPNWVAGPSNLIAFARHGEHVALSSRGVCYAGPSSCEPRRRPGHGRADQGAAGEARQGTASTWRSVQEASIMPDLRVVNEWP
jgi:hypothetical protein